MKSAVRAIGLSLVLVLISLLIACGSSSKSTPAAETIAATSGTPQSAAVGVAFTAPLVATVTQGGSPVSGATVTFTAPSSGASGIFTTSGTNTETDTTNSSGVATSSVFTAGTEAGAYMVTAAVAGVSTAANFNLTNLAGAPASVTATSGSGQSAAAGAAFTSPLVATVLDADSNPVSGVTVTFTAPSSGASGTFTTSGTNTEQDITGANGVATSSTFTANSVIGGPYTVTGTVAGVTTPANFNLTNTVPPPLIAPIGGTPQSAAVGTAFAQPLSAKVTQDGLDVKGATVTFTAPTSGASGIFATSGTSTEQDVTGTNGVATSSTFTANTAAGAYTVTAMVSGALNAANFSMTNTAAAAASIAATSGSGQSGPINTAFAAPLVATVLDQYSNPVSGVTVTFTAPSSGASGTFAGSTNGAIFTATTNASGVATSSTFTANSTVGGPYVVTGTVAGVASPANFSLTNTAASACTGTLNNGLLKGHYAFTLRGWNGATTAISAAGSFVADGQSDGAITSGLIDIVNQASTTNGGLTSTAFTGTYCVQQSNNLAIVTITPGIGGATSTLAAALDASDGNGHIISYDTSGNLMSGLLRLQTTSAFSTSSIDGTYVDGAVGADTGGNRFASAGVGTYTGAGAITGGEFDSDDAVLGPVSDGTFTSSNFAVAGTGRATADITYNGSFTRHFVYYVVSASEMLRMELDSTVSPPEVEVGQVLLQSNPSLSGNMVFSAEDISGSAAPEVQGGILTASSGSFTLDLDDNDGGTIQSAPITGNYAVGANGRMTVSGLSGCPGGCGTNNPVFYLVGPNQGFLVGTDNGVQFGMLTAQTGSNFTNSSLSGLYLGGTREAPIYNGSVEADSVNLSSGTVAGTTDKTKVNNNTTATSQETISATYAVSSNGRVVVSQGGVTQVILYIVSGSQVIGIDGQPSSSGGPTNPKLTDFHQ
ncbi:MAG: hypothetical protein WCC04_15560 [Terriglobales bacterium]